MSAFYDEAAQTALQLITEAGQPLVVKRFTKEFDSTTGTFALATAAEGTFQGVVLPFKSGVGKELDDTLKEALIKGKVRKLLLAALGSPFRPQPVDVLAGFEGENWQFYGVQPLAPGGTDLIYTAIVIRGTIGDDDAAAISFSVDDLEAAVADLHELVHETLGVNLT